MDRRGIGAAAQIHPPPCSCIQLMTPQNCNISSERAHLFDIAERQPIYAPRKKKLVAVANKKRTSKPVLTLQDCNI